MKSSIPHSTIFFSWVCALVQTSVIHIQVNWPLCSWLSVGDAGVPPLILMLFSLLAPGPSWQRHRSSTCQPPHLLAKDSSLSWVYSPIIFKSSMMTFPITTKSLLREKRGGFHNHPSTPNTQPRLANHRKELLSFPCIFHISFLMIRDTGRLFPEASYVLFIRVHVQLLSRAQPFWPPRLLACQAPLSMELSRQEYWSGLPFPTPGDLPDPGIKPKSPSLAGGFFTTAPVLGWPKSSFRFFHKVLGKNRNKLFGQLYRTWIPSRYCYCLLLPAAVPIHTPDGGGGLW